MRTKQDPLRLNRETVRHLDDELKAAVGGQQLTTQVCQKVTVPPTFCACTGTETYTNICCVG
jgi:hypothetical protein